MSAGSLQTRVGETIEGARQRLTRMWRRGEDVGSESGRTPMSSMRYVLKPSTTTVRRMLAPRTAMLSEGHRITAGAQHHVCCVASSVLHRMLRQASSSMCRHPPLFHVWVAVDRSPV